VRTLQQILAALPPQSSSYASIAAAIAASSATSMTIPAGTHAVSTSATWSVPVRHQPGAVLQLAAGVVLTYASALDAGPWPLWSLGSGASVVLAGPVASVLPQWWGASAAASAAVNAAAIEAAIETGRPVSLGGELLTIDAAISIEDDGVTLGGVGSALSVLTSTLTTGAAITSDADRVSYRGLAVRRAAAAAGTIGIAHAGTTSTPAHRLTLSDVAISAHETGARIADTASVLWRGGSIAGGTTGLQVLSTGARTVVRLDDVHLSGSVTGLSVAAGASVEAAGCTLSATTTGLRSDSSGVRLTTCHIAQTLDIIGGRLVAEACSIDGSSLADAAVKASAGAAVTLRGHWPVSGMSGKTFASATGPGTVITVESPELQRLTCAASNFARIDFVPVPAGVRRLDGGTIGTTSTRSFDFSVPCQVGDDVTIVAYRVGVTPQASSLPAYTCTAIATDTVRVSIRNDSDESMTIVEAHDLQFSVRRRSIVP
jgi:hypothetical protein